MRISNQTHLQATVNDMLQFEERLHQLSLKSTLQSLSGIL